MDDVRERIRIEELLRIIRTIDVPGPEQDVIAGTRPQATLKSQRDNHAKQNSDHHDPWRRLSQWRTNIAADDTDCISGVCLTAFSAESIVVGLFTFRGRL